MSETTMPQFPPAQLRCSATERFGPHSGPQYRSPRYYTCGCDAGYCKEHALISGPFGPPMELGTPRKCRKHRWGAEAR
jgi:hypothetical protein